MKRLLHTLRTAAWAGLCVVVCSCSQRTTTTKPVAGIYGANPKYFNNFKAKKDGSGMVMVDSKGNEITSEFSGANKEFNGGRTVARKSYDKKEFRTKEFGKKEFGRDSYAFDGDRNMRMEESDLAGRRFEGADKVADTDKTPFDRNKEVGRPPFAEADKGVSTKGYYPAEKAQREGDAEFKGTVQPYRRDDQPITFSDIKEMLNRGGE